jgi:eukaryotic-like serine/threonine-protein kinase
MLETAELIGKELGTISLIKELGRGNMGIVFLGFQKTLKRQVAVKILPKMEDGNLIASERFQSEAEILAGINHPNIIPIFEMGEDEKCFYQVMQLITGGDLDSHIKNRRKHPVPSKRFLPLTRTLDLIEQISDGLGFAHEDNIIHQDIKPANILIDERTQRPLIADFGIARTAQVQKRKNGTFVGSPLFIAPEQAALEHVDHRSDIYSLGIMLFQMCAGILPIRKNEGVKEIIRRKIKEPNSIFIDSPANWSPLIDDSLESIILKAIAPNPDDRFQDCISFKNAVTAYKTPLSMLSRIPQAEPGVAL